MLCRQTSKTVNSKNVTLVASHEAIGYIAKLPYSKQQTLKQCQKPHHKLSKTTSKIIANIEVKKLFRQTSKTMIGRNVTLVAS